jgi:hypothetical protein
MWPNLIILQTSRPGAAYMCFVDFLSRIDLGVELDYVKQVYTPLSPIKKEFEAVRRKNFSNFILV